MWIGLEDERVEEEFSSRKELVVVIEGEEDCEEGRSWMSSPR